MTALGSLKHSNEDIHIEDDLYFPICFLEVHFSIAFFVQVLFYIISTCFASYENPKFSAPDHNEDGMKECVRIKTMENI